MLDKRASWNLWCSLAAAHKVVTLSEWKQKVTTGVQTGNPLETTVVLVYFKWTNFSLLRNITYIPIYNYAVIVGVGAVASCYCFGYSGDSSSHKKKEARMSTQLALLLWLPPVVWWHYCFLVLVSFHQTRQVPRIYISVWSWDRKRQLGLERQEQLTVVYYQMQNVHNF